jgi:hypothetical protein
MLHSFTFCMNELLQTNCNTQHFMC